jgi:nicotinate phosphoribosyltransferase
MSEAYLSRGLDYYKATMGQLEFETQPNAQVTFELKNRADTQLSEYVSPEELSERLAALRRGWQPEELAYLASLQNQDGTAQFSESYLDFLADNQLPPVEVGTDNQGELTVSTTGAWPLVTFWETVVMSELNELYFERKLASEGKTLNGLYDEGDRRLTQKIARLQERPDIKFSDFGTRRRFSYQWQKHVVERVATELPDNFLGTSNIYLAHELGLRPIGTFAHELPMVYAALADSTGNNPLDGHNQVLQDWERLYKDDLSTALTDTFTSDFFFADFTPEQAKSWNALRHDSGDPIEFGEKVIAFYEQHDIDPQEKTIVFSDGLNIDTIVQLADHFAKKINIVFGWGTTLTNDLGVTANNFVMKATAVNKTPTVKLSDVEGKHTGPVETIERYKGLVEERLGHIAMRETVAV